MPNSTTPPAAQAHELHQLLDISAELGSIGQLDEFLQQFALRAADFLGFGRGFIGLLENGAFHVRWAAENGQPKRGRLRPSRRARQPGPAQQGSLLVGRAQQDPRSKSGGPDQVRGAAVVDRPSARYARAKSWACLVCWTGWIGAGISQEDIRRARALAAQVAVALEVTRNLHQSEQHRRRAESLMGLALELNRHLRLPDFARSFAGRAADILGAHRAALVVKQESGLETLVLHGADGREIQEPLVAAALQPCPGRSAGATRRHDRLFHGRRIVRRRRWPPNWAEADLHPGAAAGRLRGTGGRAVPGRSRAARA